MQVVPDPTPDENVIMFRDPFVWSVEGGWRMAVGAGYVDGRSAIRLYGRRTCANGPVSATSQACPDSTATDPRPATRGNAPRFSTWPAARSPSWAHGARPEGPNSVLSLVVGEPTRLAVVDHGTNFYAASALRESQFGPLMFGWITEGREQDRWPEAGWAGALSLPRQVWLGADDTVRSAPVPSVAGLRVGAAAPAERRTHRRTMRDRRADCAGPCAACASARRNISTWSSKRSANTLTVDRTAASTDPAAHGGTATAHDAFDDATGRPAARIFVDGSIVEVFTSAGRVLTTRVYPVTPPPWQIEAPEAVRGLAPGRNRLSPAGIGDGQRPGHLATEPAADNVIPTR